MLLPVCVQCKREMYCEKNSFGVSQNKSGHIWYGDKYKCQGCNNEIVIGFGKRTQFSVTSSPDLLIE